MESCSFCNLDAMGVESLKEDASEPFHIQIDGLERRADDLFDYGCKFFLMRHSIGQKTHKYNCSLHPGNSEQSHTPCRIQSDCLLFIFFSLTFKLPGSNLYTDYALIKGQEVAL